MSDDGKKKDLSTEELTGIRDVLAAKKSGEHDALEPAPAAAPAAAPTPPAMPALPDPHGPLPASVQSSYLGQVAYGIHRITGIPTRAVMIGLAIFALWFYYQHGTFPTVDLARKEAGDKAAEVVKADEMKVHKRLNTLDASYRNGCEAQQVRIDKLSAQLKTQARAIEGLHAKTFLHDGQIIRLGGIHGLVVVTSTTVR